MVPSDFVMTNRRVKNVNKRQSRQISQRMVQYLSAEKPDLKFLWLARCLLVVPPQKYHRPRTYLNSWSAVARRRILFSFINPKSAHAGPRRHCTANKKTGSSERWLKVLRFLFLSLPITLHISCLRSAKAMNGQTPERESPSIGKQSASSAKSRARFAFVTTRRNWGINKSKSEREQQRQTAPIRSAYPSLGAINIQLRVPGRAYMNSDLMLRLTRMSSSLFTA